MEKDWFWIKTTNQSTNKPNESGLTKTMLHAYVLQCELYT